VPVAVVLGTTAEVWRVCVSCFHRVTVWSNQSIERDLLRKPLIFSVSRLHSGVTTCQSSASMSCWLASHPG
jgi:hypothetical protein